MSATVIRSKGQGAGLSIICWNFQELSIAWRWLVFFIQ